MDMVQRTVREALRQANGTVVKSQGMTWYSTLLKSSETMSLAKAQRMAADYPGPFGAKKLAVLQYEPGRMIGIKVSWKHRSTTVRPPRGENRRKKK